MDVLKSVKDRVRAQYTQAAIGGKLDEEGDRERRLAVVKLNCLDDVLIQLDLAIKGQRHG